MPIKIEVGDRISSPTADGQGGVRCHHHTLIIQLDDGGGLMRVASDDVATIEKAKEDASA